jgi:FkbM family methyltransferase
MSALIDRITAYQEQMGIHRAGTCSPAPLSKLEWYLREYFHGDPVRTVETGCGASTIVFAEYAERHKSYCYDDRELEGSSVRYAQEFPGFRDERVCWVFGPTQRTIFEQPPEGHVDVVLLDGPHGYPFPELEYFAFYRCLRPGGVLVVDDIHIPTIHHLYEFLTQDEGFRFDGLSQTTAYFQRTDAQPFDMEGDGWWLQRYNTRSFPAVPIVGHQVGMRLPVRLGFDCGRVSRSPVLLCGFSVLDSPPLSDGALSMLDIPLERHDSADLTVELEIEPVSVEQREGSGVAILVNSRPAGEWVFDAPGRCTLRFDVPANGIDRLRLECQNHGLKSISELSGWVKPWPDLRLPNFWLHSITVRGATEANPNTLRRADGSIVSFEYHDQSFCFFVDEPDDHVGAHHIAGEFYALDELEALQHYVGPGASVLDIGAHAGNHCVYFEKVLGARRVVPIEPNPRAQFMLRANCALNNLQTVDLSHLCRALGDKPTVGSLVRAEAFNSGGTRIALGDGAIAVSRGDDIFASEGFDLIKIDVQGMELEVLEGLSETVRRCRPVVLVEVADANIVAFNETLKHWSFVAGWKTETAPGVTSFITAPAESSTMREVVTSPGPCQTAVGQVREDVVAKLRPLIPRRLRRPLRRLVGRPS